jgi:D-alanyl-D-alanine carboxypeptidase
MKGWIAGVALVVVMVASGVGLWTTWDSTQTATTDSLSAAPRDLITSTTSTTSALRAAGSTTTLPPAPPCAVGDDPVEGDPTADWATLVIDTRYRLPESFVPDDLVSVSRAGFDSEDRIREVVIDDLTALRQAAEDNDTPLVVVSAYRSYDYQNDLFQRRVDAIGEEEAARRTARPGHSEHQLGTAVDVLNAGQVDLSSAFAITPAGRWVAAHAHEFGFVVSYPEGAAARSCYEFEPWHLRYVGRDAAASIHDAGVTPREWMVGTRASTGG